jgi:trimethylamine-N-oxide reductase (cytochrome c)
MTWNLLHLARVCRERGIGLMPVVGNTEEMIMQDSARPLAREWAAKKTMLAPGSNHGMGGACRSATGNEWTRAMVALAAMQGMGKPGSNIWATTTGTPVDCSFVMDGYAEGGISGDCENSAAGFKFAWRMFDGKTTFPAPTNINTAAGQHVPRLKVPECIMEASSGSAKLPAATSSTRCTSTGTGAGLSQDRCWKYGGPWIGTAGATNRCARMYTDPSLEFVVSQSIWFEGEYVRRHHAGSRTSSWDISGFANCSLHPRHLRQCNHRVISCGPSASSPSESPSPTQIYAMIARSSASGRCSPRQDELVGGAVLQRHRHAEAHDLRRV